MPRIDETTRRVVEDFRSRMAALFGARFRGLYLYGSRARGDHRPDSDVDVAIVLDGVRDHRADEGLADDAAFEVLLDHGIVLHHWVVDRASLDDPEAFPNPHLTRSILGEGVRLSADDADDAVREEDAAAVVTKADVFVARASDLLGIGG